MNISIKDRPIERAQEDQLKAKRYVQALANFILKSDTPITIGLQGEWGTGKTSMMHMLLETLSSSGVATSWVNTWEYSMFRGVKETTPAVLYGLLSSLEQSCGKNWTVSQETEKKMNKVWRFLGNVGNQLAANHLGVDMKSASEGLKPDEVLKRTEIVEIKNDISDIITKLISDSRNDYERIVFFVDDLDRINPTDAVEILEALKNIFDMNHCIFVLAIDYEVVVKGLERKFGKKTEENEREFRSFFDKIIQVPFSMPVGAYDIDFFLVEKLRGLGLTVPDNLRQHYLEVVKNSVGNNPRSLKRFMNTFSLLNTIRKSEQEVSGTPSTHDGELMLFALLGIQITYPKIFRYISMNQNYLSWDSGFAARIGLDWAKIQDKIKDYGDDTRVDDDWEKVTWGLCQSDPYLKSRAFSILELLNRLSDHFKDQLEEEINMALEYAAITSVDDNHDSKQGIIQIGESRIRFSGLDAKKKQLAEWKGNPTAIELWYQIVSRIDHQLGSIGTKINYAKTATTFYRKSSEVGEKEIQTFYCDNPKGKYPGLKANFYGYSSEFVSDVIELAKNFGWTINRSALEEEGKTEFAPGIHLSKPSEGWKLAFHGMVGVSYDFALKNPKDKTEGFLIALTEKMVSRLKGS